MKHSVSSLVLLVALVVLSSLVELTHARLGGDETKSAATTTTTTTDDDILTTTEHDGTPPDLTNDLVTMNNTLPEFQDASIARIHTSARIRSTLTSDRDLQRRSFSNPNRDKLLAAFDNNNHDNDNDNMVRVMVGFKNDEGRQSARGFAGAGTGAGAQRWQEMRNMRVATMMIAKTSLESLQRNPNIDYVETDGIIMPDAEAFPVGIKVSQGGSRTAIHRTTASAGSGGACNDPNSFKVAIVDSGLQGNHPDLPCRNVNAADSNCIGESFGVGNLPWFAPGAKAWHGTHVFGTMAANGDNDQGVTSMVPDSEASDICYMIIRVFDDDGNGQFASVLFEGIDWAISQGANVINMSLSGGSKYMTGQATFDRAHAAGILSVAAAGNGGSASLRYPASYNHVISVAATDNWGRRASFSQTNNKVDIAAPGVSVMSTVVGGNYAFSSGTSMATPHVTGAIARVWSGCRSCSSAQVEQCLLNSASGNGSRTNDIGYGMVRAEDTYTCLVETMKCCAQEVETIVSHTDVTDSLVDEGDPEPVPPSTSPSTSPSSGPTTSPFVGPSAMPSVAPSVSHVTVSGCSRQQEGQPCRRDSHCCSEKCQVITSRSMICSG